MPSKGRMFAGCTVALVTPFRDGEVDFQALDASVDWQVAQGTPVLSPVGTTGESPTLSHDEHERVIAAVVERAAGRAKVLAGTGSNATAEAVRLTRFAAKAGADDGADRRRLTTTGRPRRGSTPTSPGSPRASTCRMVLYNVPARTGRNIDPETVERLAKIGPVVAIKEASGSLDQVSDVLARTNLTVLSGDDSLTLPMLAVGAEGVVSVVANLVPRTSSRCSTRSHSGDWAEARRWHAQLFPLCRDLLGLAPNPIPVKTALALLGRGNGEIRLPLCPLDDRALEALKRTLVRYGLLAAVADFAARRRSLAEVAPMTDR